MATTTPSQQNENLPRTFSDFIKSKSDSLDYLLKVLPNGLKILMVSDPNSHKSAASMNVNIGSLSDPEDSPGLAHFCEHMLFMGTEKYPKEEEYKAFIAQNGGSTNAFTSGDITCFYFDVSNNSFSEALDRFAQFFISPLFNKESVEKEIKAIDSENKKNLNNDLWRLNQLRRSESKKESVFNKFSTGNLEVLNKPSIREELLEMHKKLYSSDIMYLCVVSNKTLSQLEELVTSLFSQVPKKENLVLPKYDAVLPYDESNLGYFYRVEPIQDMDTIKFYWYLPEESKLYKYQPLNYLCEILGHEGPNSLASSLFKDDLITSLLTDKNTIAKTVSVLSLTIRLTKKGLANFNELILRVFKFLSILQKLPISKTYFEEFKKVRKLAFDVKSKAEPSSYSRLLSSHLLKYEDRDIISGEYIVRDFNEDLISKYLHLLTPKQCNIFLITSENKGKCGLVEKWYGTKYTKEKMSITQEEIDNASCAHPLGYPPENNFLPDSLEMLPPPKEIKKYPTKIFSSERCVIWHKQDTTFNLPKACVRCKISPQENTCGNSIIMNDIICSILNIFVKNELRETSYMARQAYIDFSLTMKYDSFYLLSTGFNKSMYNVIKTLLESFKSLDFSGKEKAFELQITKMKQESSNFFFRNVYMVSYSFLDFLLLSPSYSNLDMLMVLMEDKIKLSDLLNYAKKFMENAKYEWLIQGNLLEEDAKKIVTMCNDLFAVDTKTETPTKINITRSVNLSSKSNYVYIFTHPNPEELNSSISSFYQCGHLSDKEKMLLYILEHYLKTKFMDDLRTNQGLGYVSLLISREYRGNSGIVCLVQSNTKEPEYVSGKIRNFFKESWEKIKVITDDEFKSYVNSVMVEQKKKDINLIEETSRNYAEITRHYYNFDRKEKNCEILENLKKEELIEFYNVHFCEDIRKLDVEYVAECHKANNEKLFEETKEENGIKRIRINSIKELSMMNELFPDFFNLKK